MKPYICYITYNKSVFVLKIYWKIQSTLTQNRTPLHTSESCVWRRVPPRPLVGWSWPHTLPSARRDLCAWQRSPESCGLILLYATPCSNLLPKKINVLLRMLHKKVKFLMSQIPLTVLIKSGCVRWVQEWPNALINENRPFCLKRLRCLFLR